MTKGVRPAAFNRSRPLAPQAITKMLIHGYCSSTNPWDGQGFTNAYSFLHKSASVTHDTFANLIAQAAQKENLAYFGGIGHSQGGPALLTLHNFYWSGLELAPNGRIIQSVGSPYRGCSAAGSAADLGKRFGVGCGANFDLSRDGSLLWFPTISTEAQRDVYYYTTQYQTGYLINYCNLAMNFILQWPNDGTTEYDYTNVGGTNMGHIKGWCHTTGMSHSPQYQDPSRNAVLNAQAPQ